VQLESSAIAGSNLSDALTPEQYYDGIRADDASVRPIKRLMLAVLEDAMRCYQTYATSRNRAQRRLFVDAEMWLMDRHASGVFAFETVCETLGIEPSCLRAGLRRWRLQQLDGMNPRRLARRSPVTSTSRISAPLKRRRRKLAQATGGDDNNVAVAVNAECNGVGHHGSDMHHGGDVLDDRVGYDQGGEIESFNGTEPADGPEASASGQEAIVSPRETSVLSRETSVSPRIELQEIALA
jgi:hypothetical protein